MGKVSPKDVESKTSKHGKKSRGPAPAKRYLKPGALAQIRHGKAIATKYCPDLGKKRVGLFQDKQTNENDMTVTVNEEPQSMLSPVKFLLTPVSESRDLSQQSSTGLFIEQTQSMVSPVRFMLSPVTPGSCDLSKQSNLLKTPKTPLLVAGTFESDSRLEAMPTDILVKILCHLHHDQLRAVFHVSQRVRKAVLIARQYHFNYTTPDRSRQEMLQALTPLPKEHWPFVCKGGDEIPFLKRIPHTPKAPRHGPRPPSRLKCTDMKQIAAVLFREPSFPPSRCTVPSVISKPSSKNRVLIYEEELCQAVAENKLL